MQIGFHLFSERGVVPHLTIFVELERERIGCLETGRNLEAILCKTDLQSLSGFVIRLLATKPGLVIARRWIDNSFFGQGDFADQVAVLKCSTIVKIRQAENDEVAADKIEVVSEII